MSSLSSSSALIPSSRPGNTKRKKSSEEVAEKKSKKNPPVVGIELRIYRIYDMETSSWKPLGTFTKGLGYSELSRDENVAFRKSNPKRKGVQPDSIMDRYTRAGLSYTGATESREATIAENSFLRSTIGGGLDKEMPYYERLVDLLRIFNT
jgi:hypothetical protein